MTMTAPKKKERVMPALRGEVTLYIPGLAAKLCTTEWSIRWHLRTDPKRLPAARRLGRKYYWLESEVDAWLRSQPLDALGA